MQNQSAILLTGGSGRLGQAIIRSGLFANILTPSSEVLDICDPQKIKKFFDSNKIDAIIHAAALARLITCEEKPTEAIQKNIIGTSNIVNEIIFQQTKNKKEIRFIHISTDGVYESRSGNYSENGPTLPRTMYGWSKLGAECAVNMLSNHCIIRTRFFDPANIPFDTAAVDLYTSRIAINKLIGSIHQLLNSDFTGIINIGEEKKSDFDVYRVLKPDIKPCTRSDIEKDVSFNVPHDVSMDISKMKKVLKPLTADSNG